MPQSTLWGYSTALGDKHPCGVTALSPPEHHSHIRASPCHTGHGDTAQGTPVALSSSMPWLSTGIWGLGAPSTSLRVSENPETSTGSCRAGKLQLLLQCSNRRGDLSSETRPGPPQLGETAEPLMLQHWSISLPSAMDILKMFPDGERNIS